MELKQQEIDDFKNAVTQSYKRKLDADICDFYFSQIPHSIPKKELGLFEKIRFSIRGFYYEARNFIIKGICDFFDYYPSDPLDDRW